MTYTEREIARLEGMKDGLIKKLVEECEEINDQIIALRKGTPRKKDSEIYFDRGYAKGRAEAMDEELQSFAQWLWDNNYLVDEAFTIKLVEQYKERNNVRGNM